MATSTNAATDGETTTLLAASKVISASVAHSLAAVEEQVSVPGLRVLVRVQANGSLNLSAVADALGVNASSASRTCERLVAAGLLDRRDSPLDRRQVALTLTRQGAKFVDTVMDERIAILTRVVEEMPTGERRSLMKGLDSFVAAAAALSEDSGRLDDHTGLLLRWVV